MKRPSPGIIIIAAFQILGMIQPFLYSFASMAVGFLMFFIPVIFLVFIGSRAIVFINKRLKNKNIIYYVLGGLMMFVMICFFAGLRNGKVAAWGSVINIVYMFSVFACGIGLLRLNKYAMIFSILFAPLRVAVELFTIHCGLSSEYRDNHAGIEVSSKQRRAVLLGWGVVFYVPGIQRGGAVFQ